MLDTATLDARREEERFAEEQQLLQTDIEMSELRKHIETKERKRQGIAQNRQMRDGETPQHRAARFERYDHREALADLRYAVTGERRKQKAKTHPKYAIVAVAEYIYRRFRKAKYATWKLRDGSTVSRSRLLPDGGVEIGLDEIKAHVDKHVPKQRRTDKPGFSKRHVKRFIKEVVDLGYLEVQKRGQSRSYVPKWT